MMRCWTVWGPDSEDEEAAGLGIRVATSPQGSALEFGEAGRGRSIARVYLGTRDATSLVAPTGKDTRWAWDPRIPSSQFLLVRRAGFLRTAGGVPLAVAETASESTDPRAAIAVRVKAGFRGCTQFYCYAPASPCPHQGEPHFSVRLLRGTDGLLCSQCGERVEEKGHHPETGCVSYVPMMSRVFPGIAVVAQGKCAQGDAGYMGGHTEWLLIAEPETRFRVIRAGRLYGAPSVIEVRVGTEGTVRALTPIRWQALDALTAFSR